VRKIKKVKISVILSLIIFILLSFTVRATNVLGQPSSKQIKNKVIINFKKTPGAKEKALVKKFNGKIKYSYQLVPAIAATIPETAKKGLLQNANVIKIEPDTLAKAQDAELDNSWGVKRIGSGEVHTSNKGAGVSIAIIDSGINYNHPDLDDNYSGGYDFVDSDDDPMDVYGHGTHVAGTACAEDNNVDYSVIGVAPECALYSLRVLDADGYGYASDIIAAMEWAVETNIKVANLSLGFSQNPGDAVKSAFDNAQQAGLITVAAAGNSGNPPGKGNNVIYPAIYDSVIAVAATDSKDKRASFSSTGDQVEISAPGVSVYSCWNDGTSYYDPQPDCYGENTDCYKYGSGTSMASPHVAGTAALIVASGIQDTNLNGRTNDEVRLRLNQTAEDLGTTGRDPQYGYGLVNAAKAALPNCSQDADCASGEICCSGQCIAPVCSVNNDCNDGNACTIDACNNPDTCSAECSFTEITECMDNDGCCPSGCDSNNDNDCSAQESCGDKYCAGWSSGEDCFTCPEDCRCVGPDCSKGCCGNGTLEGGENIHNCPIDFE